MAFRLHSDETRREALELYRTEGLNEAARRTGIAKATLRSWSREAGLDGDMRSSAERRAEQNRRAAEVSGARAARELAEVNERLVGRLARVSEAGLIRQLELLAAGGFEPKDIAALSQATWRAINHLELLQGRATSRIDFGLEQERMLQGVMLVMNEILARVAAAVSHEFSEELRALLADRLRTAVDEAGLIEQPAIEEAEVAEIEPGEEAA